MNVLNTISPFAFCSIPARSRKRLTLFAVMLILTGCSPERDLSFVLVEVRAKDLSLSTNVVEVSGEADLVAVVRNEVLGTRYFFRDLGVDHRGRFEVDSSPDPSTAYMAPGRAGTNWISIEARVGGRLLASNTICVRVVERGVRPVVSISEATDLLREQWDQESGVRLKAGESGLILALDGSHGDYTTTPNRPFRYDQSTVLLIDYDSFDNGLADSDGEGRLRIQLEVFDSSGKYFVSSARKPPELAYDAVELLSPDSINICNEIRRLVPDARSGFTRPKLFLANGARGVRLKRFELRQASAASLTLPRTPSATSGISRNLVEPGQSARWSQRGGLIIEEPATGGYRFRSVPGIGNPNAFHYNKLALGSPSILRLAYSNLDGVLIVQIECFSARDSRFLTLPTGRPPEVKLADPEYQADLNIAELVAPLVQQDRVQSIRVRLWLTGRSVDIKELGLVN